MEIYNVRVDLSSRSSMTGITFDCQYPHGNWFGDTEEFLAVLEENKRDITGETELIFTVPAYLMEDDSCKEWARELYEAFRSFKEESYES